MCRINPSESGHGGGFVPCEEYKRLEQKYNALREAANMLATTAIILTGAFCKDSGDKGTRLVSVEDLKALRSVAKAYKEVRDVG